ncbi:hypothetical protein BDB00DRAFT_784656 [Zychaea mexicana]|uniref:uncharacterized protein n=1 Tax=Zychaea mexicana TaxID=64656 RepID=UPI0022FEDDBC|nr:uncharacterized protein BDB00DRAFT_784656 [Zychaea mexicana]KAI9497740.1 hypothetical protein BDB00DRAFT_784656 [Zychaea mexicana]
MGNEPEKIETRGLLLSAAGAFGAGLMGAIWHTKRKQAKEAAAEAKAAVATAATAKTTTTNTTLNTTTTTASPAATLSIPQSPKSNIPEYTPPKMTPAEYAVAKQEARFFAFKALGYGSLLALGGAGILAVGIGYWLDVSNFKDFSDRLKVIVPRQTSKLRALLGGKEFVMKPEEEEEWNRAVENDE